MPNPYKSYTLTLGSGNNTFQDTTRSDGMSTEYIGLYHGDAVDFGSGSLTPSTSISTSKLSLGNYQASDAGSTYTAKMGGAYASPPGGGDREIYISLIESDNPITQLGTSTDPVVAVATINMPAASPAQVWDDALSLDYVLDPTKFYNVSINGSGNNVSLFSDTSTGEGPTARDGNGDGSAPANFIGNGSGANSNLILWIEVDVVASSGPSPSLTTPFSVEATNNLEKKQESRSASVIEEGLDGFGTTTESYKLIKLPWNSLITDAYVMVEEASSLASTTVTLGTTEGADDIMQAADLTTAGKQGTFAGEQIVKIGKPVFANFDYPNAGDTTGKFILVVEYLEYRKGTGEYTKLYTKV